MDTVRTTWILFSLQVPRCRNTSQHQLPPLAALVHPVTSWVMNELYPRYIAWVFSFWVFPTSFSYRRERVAKPNNLLLRRKTQSPFISVPSFLADTVFSWDLCYFRVWQKSVRTGFLDFIAVIYYFFLLYLWDFTPSALLTAISSASSTPKPKSLWAEADCPIQS